jgi:hypothetical protein
VAIVALALSATAAAAVPKHWYWGESLAEQMVVKKVRIPCAVIYGARSADCDVASLQREYDSIMAQMNACNVCDSSCGLQYAYGAQSAVERLKVAESGFGVQTAACHGIGQASRSHPWLYGQFSCRVELFAQRFGDKTRRWGRLVVTLTGRRTFRWRII